MKNRDRLIKPLVPQTPNLPIIGGLILFTVILGTTDLGYIPVPTEAKSATTMHLPTIVTSLLEGWPAGMVVGAIFGMTSMYSGQTVMSSDPLVALLPRILVGLTPFLTYNLMRHRHDYLRIGVAAVVGTMTNTVGFLSVSVMQGYMKPEVALSIALKHGIPESVVAVVICIPAVIALRRAQAYLRKYEN